MTYEELVKDMKNTMGSSFLSRKQFADYMGYKDPHGVDKVLATCQKFGSKYHVIDLANNLFRCADDAVD